jgi:hypothetical protein
VPTPRVVGLALFAVLLLALAPTAQAKLPTPVRAADGAFAVAAPGYESPPGESGLLLAGESVLWQTSFDYSLTAIRRADRDGSVSTVYAPPRSSRNTSAFGLAASESHVALLRDGVRRHPGCPAVRCPPRVFGELLAGPVGRPLRRLLPGTRTFRARFGCRGRGRAFLTERVGFEPALSLSGHRLLYAERLRCPRQWVKSHYQLVLHDLRSGKRRVIHRGAVPTAQLAGPYLAYEAWPRRPIVGVGPGGEAVERGPRVVVEDTRTGKAVYRTPRQTSLDDELHWPTLDTNGTLVGAHVEGLSLDGALGWFSPAEPRFHPVPLQLSIFSSAPLAIANGRIAFVRRLGEGSDYELIVGDLQGNAETYAKFSEPEQLTDFAFDGERIAWVVSRYRAYRGRRDDNLPYVCDYRGPRVLVAAPVVEVHPVGRPGRIAADQLPHAPALRDPAIGRPSCNEG